MTISLIAAMNRRRAIGRGNALMWHLPRDLRFFRETTSGKPVVMGRSTFESIGRPLPRRTNVVLSRQAGYAPAGVRVVGSMDEALEAAGEAPEVMIIGGAAVYAQFLERAHRVYLTHVDDDTDGDAYFPELDAEWTQVSCLEAGPDAENVFGCRFVTYERISAGCLPEIGPCPAALEGASTTS